MMPNPDKLPEKAVGLWRVVTTDDQGKQIAYFLARGFRDLLRQWEAYAAEGEEPDVVELVAHENTTGFESDLPTFVIDELSASISVN